MHFLKKTLLISTLCLSSSWAYAYEFCVVNTIPPETAGLVSINAAVSINYQPMEFWLTTGTVNGVLNLMRGSKGCISYSDSQLGTQFNNNKRDFQLHVKFDITPSMPSSNLKAGSCAGTFEGIPYPKSTIAYVSAPNGQLECTVQFVA